MHHIQGLGENLHIGPSQVSTPARCTLSTIQFAGTHSHETFLLHLGYRERAHITSQHQQTRSPALTLLITTPAHVNHSHGGDSLDGTHRAGRLSLLHPRYGCATSQLPPATIESPRAQQQGPASVRRYTTCSHRTPQLSHDDKL